MKGDQINLITEFDDEKLEGFFELGNNLSPFIVKYGKDLIDQVQEELKIEEIRDDYHKNSFQNVFFRRRYRHGEFL